MLLANGGDSDVGLSNGSLNGLVGVIEGSFNKTTLRFVVVLNDEGDGKRKVNVKMSNLEVVK